jgi:hypothetical protein
MRNDFLNLYEQAGLFSYEVEGFTVELADGPRKYLYADVVAIIAFKVDRSSYDEIRLELFFDDYGLRITEDVPGWYQFVLRIKAAFPSIPRDWDLRMPFPPGDMDLVVLYRREAAGATQGCA